jgi:type II secretory pathway component PulK
LKPLKHILKQAARTRAARGEKGAALLTVLVALMIITIMLFEFQYAAMIERKLAYNELNQIQAYYLAKSGARVGALRVALYARLKNNPQLKSLAASSGNPNMLNSVLDQIWQMTLPAFPPDISQVKQLGNADRTAAETLLKETKISEGSYTVTIRSESSKLNLNALEVPANQTSGRPSFTEPPTRPDLFVGLMLVNMMNGFLKESDDPYAEWPNLRPEEQVMDIMDWRSAGDNRLMGGSKDSYYTGLNPPYRAKKGRFFTVEELKLVRGMDEHLYEKLKPYVTVYSYDSKLNINSANETMLRAIYRDFTDDDIKRINEQKAKLGTWSSEKQFVDFIVQTLGRSGFATVYADPNNYPFTTGTESFLIESLGVIRKSASSVQRSIKVALAFTTARGGTVIQGMGQADCVKAPQSQFWNASTGQCFTNPRSASECEAIPGQTQQSGSQMVCLVQQYAPNPPISIPIVAAGGAGGGGGSGQPGAAPAAKPAGTNTMKILYWAES